MPMLMMIIRWILWMNLLRNLMVVILYTIHIIEMRMINTITQWKEKHMLIK